MLNNIFKLKIKENEIYLITSFLVYGFYASGTDIHSNQGIVYYLLPIILIPFIFLIKKKDNEIIINLEKIKQFFVNKEYLIIFFLIFSVFTFISWEKLNLSISDDEYDYTNLGLKHSIQLSKIFFQKIQYFEDWNVSFLIQVLNLFFLLLLILFIYLVILIGRKSLYFSLFFTISLIAVARTIIFYMGGNTFPHPPFVGLPLIPFTAIFGLNDISIRLSYLFLFSFFALYIYFQFKFVLNKYLSFFIVLSIFSIPGIIYLGSTIEQSLWTTICFCIILFETKNINQINYKKIFIIIMFFSFFRILCLLSLILVFLTVLIRSESFKSLKNEILIILKNSYPLLFLLPLILYSFLDHSNLTIDRLNIDKTNYFILYKDLPKYILNNYNIVSGTLLMFFIIISFFYRNLLINLIFIICITFIYASQFRDSLADFRISPKYIYEIYFPFFLISIFLIFLGNKNFFFKTIYICLLFFMFLYNIYFLKNFSNLCLKDNNPFKNNHEYIVKFGCNIHISRPFNIKNAFNFLTQEETFNFGNLYVPGVYYGMLPSIINGIEFKSLDQHRRVLENQNNLNLKNSINWISASKDNIISDKNIKYVLISDVLNNETIIHELLKSGWKKIYSDKETTFKTKNIVLKINN